MDKIKNLEIEFAKRTIDSTEVQDLFFVREDWIPENSYVLKADIVDSSHANNASIGKFINDNFKYGNTFDFGFDEGGIAQTNILASTASLKDSQGWNINPSLKHTVEGFQVMLLVRFYNLKKDNESEKGNEHGVYKNLGIYSFNISRKAARNLGFENITSITDKDGNLITDKIAPFILENVKVNTQYDDESNVYWLENSETVNFSAISSWTTDTVEIVPDATRATTPADGCRFWHKKVTKIGSTDVDDYKLDYEFDVKYNNTTTERSPSQIVQFVKFVQQISELPVEGLSKSASRSVSNSQIGGKYVTAICDSKGKYVDIPSQYHELKSEIND